MQISIKKASIILWAMAALFAGATLVGMYFLESQTRYYGLLSGYTGSVHRAVFIDDEGRGARPDIPRIRKGISPYPLCTRDTLTSAADMANSSFETPCNIVEGTRQPPTAFWGPTSCVSLNCIWLTVHPDLYADDALRGKITDAITRPCVYYLAFPVLESLSEIAKSDAGRRQIAERYGVYATSDLNEQRNAYGSFGCHLAEERYRKVILQHGDEVTIVETDQN